MLPNQKLFIAIAAATLSVGLHAQPTQCTANAGVPLTLRQEGLAEQIGDVVLTCTGGVPAKAGAPIPKSDVTIYLNTNVTSRILAVSNDIWLEALLLIDEPHSPANPSVGLLACGDALAPDVPATPGVCEMTGTGSGLAVYDGSAKRPNVFQGKLNGNSSITWTGVPIDAPPNGGSRSIRITNVRISGPQVPMMDNPQIPNIAAMSISIGGSSPVPVTLNDFTRITDLPVLNGIPSLAVAYLQRGLYFLDPRYPVNLQQSQSHNAGVATGADYSNASADFVVTVREGFQSAFPRKNWGYTLNATTEVNQNVPGLAYNTSSGFENLGPSFDPVPNPPPQLTYPGPAYTIAPTAGFPTYHGMVGAGTVDTATRVESSFTNVPAGAVLAVPTAIELRSQLTLAITGVARLMSTDSSGLGNTFEASLPGGAITGCSTNITASGSYCPASTGLALVPVSGGTGLAVYQIMYSDAFNPEEVFIPVAVAYIANPASNLPTSGVTLVTPRLGPVSPVSTASSNDSIPRFSAAAGVPMNAFAVTRKAASYTGLIESTTGCVIAGWAADRNLPGASISVSFYNGTSFLARITAGLPRPDVGTVLGDNGLHGFSYKLPTGIPYSNDFHMRYDATSIDIAGSPKAVTCDPYVGYLDSASCSGITGWDADRSYLNYSLGVSLWEGGKMIAPGAADKLRADVGKFLGDNGLHGFSLPYPASFMDGLPHAIEVHFDQSAAGLIGPPFTLTCGTKAPPAPVYAGYIDSSSCSGISGWAADRSRPNQSITVSLWDGAIQVGSTVASGARPDVGAVLGDNGLHAFTLPIPPGYSNGIAHTLQVRYELSSTTLGAPIPLTCGGAANYAGFVDVSSCYVVRGWAADRNRPGQSISVSVYDGTTLLTPSFMADQYREDVGAYLGDTGVHGFTYFLPSSLYDGKPHTIHIFYAASSDIELGGSPIPLTCGANGTIYAGYIDSASCSGFSGWIADRTRLNQPLTVSLWKGPALVESIIADKARPDVGAVVGDNGFHGFTMKLPAAYANGFTHTLQVHYETSSTPVAAPVSLTCGGAADYTGWLDHAACDSISGWAADRGRLNQPIPVDILDGTSVIATLSAAQSRPDVGTAIGDAGAHGFTLATPASLKDGKPHSIQVRYNGSSQFVGNSPRPLQCP